jgi:dienelactone hydrolase
MPTSPYQLSYLRMLDMYAGLRRQSRSCAVYLLRYRLRGWNPGHGLPDPVRDARWALDQIRDRHPGLPVGLLGHSMGARTAFAVADDPQVVGVCALAPWLPQQEPLPPVRSGARYVIAHGTADRMTSPTLSKVYAQRLRAAGAAVARFEFPDAKHALLDSPGLWHRFAVQTTLGLVGDRPLPAGVATALEEESADDLGRALSSALA